MTWYVGDPCYIIPENEWVDFCFATFAEENQKKGEHYSHIDSVIEWHGQTLTIWSNGGDGTWSFSKRNLRTENDADSFGVDAGIFCVIDLDKLQGHYKGDPADCGMIFAEEPDLHVEDGVVFINDEPDDSHEQCYECGEYTYDYGWVCDFNRCEGCDHCFECNCLSCDECDEHLEDCACEEDEEE